ncbi:MAG: hypothetical protein IJA34_17880 [Lachnospiraceae bacterium]|nr:hypothetical protein [Lachnospiraceae bacterium]
MKKNIKKCLAIGLVSIMSLSMFTGCGTKKENNDKKDDKVKVSKVDIELKDLLSEAAISIADIETVKLGVGGSVKLKYISEDMDMDISGDAKLEGIAAVDEPKFNATGSLNYELGMSGTKLSGDYTLEAYADTLDEEMSIYAKINDEDWMTEAGDVSEYMEEIGYLKENIEELSTMIEEIDFSVLDEYKDYIRLEDKTKIVDGVECYVVSANLNKEQLKELYEEFEGDASEMEEELDTVKDFAITCEFLFDKSNCAPAKFGVDMSMTIEEGDETIEVESLGFEMSLGVNTKDKIKDVPAEAKDNAGPADMNIADILY